MNDLQQYPKLIPIPGLLLEAYMSREDIGSGRRLFIVHTVGPKWISLFYPPHLRAIRLRRSEFASLYISPVVKIDAKAMKKRLRARAAHYKQYNMEFQSVTTKEMLNLKFVSGGDLFALARNGHKPPKEKTNV